MLEFFQMYGADILAALVALAGATVSISSVIKMFKSENRTTKITEDLKNDIKITQEGIVEAFKKSKISTEWKVSINNQVNKILTDWANKFMEQYKEQERLRTELAISNAKILSYTAAYDKLSDEEKEHIQNILKELSDEDITIELDEGE